MLLSTGRMVALRCPLCGRFALHSLSLFSFVRGRPLHINCGCGYNILTISSAAHKSYLIRISCLACTGSHTLRFPKREFWGDEVLRLRCPQASVEIGYIGSEHAMHQVIEDGRNKLESIANDLGFTDLFNRPEIMVQVLSHLHFLAENDNLSCQCGSREIEIEVFPDKLELRCISCESLLIIYGETQEDLAMVNKMPRIVMAEYGFASIDASKLTQER